jgi:DNA-binding CsgD family transcriptional regulator
VTTGGVHEVWARAAWAAVDMSGELGVSPDSLLVDLPYDAAELRRKKRIPWADYAAICERVGEAAGGMAELEELLADAYHNVVPELRLMAGALVGPRTFVRFVFDVIDPLVFPAIAFTCDDLPDGRLRCGCILRPGARPCEAFFRGSVGTVRGITAQLGLPMAEVELLEMGPDRLICDVRLPASRTLAHRARTAARRLATRFVIGRERDGTDVTMTVAAPDGDPLEHRVEHAIGAWQLTPRQADVLAHVAAGLANKEIASELSCADNTIELHVTRLLRKAGVTTRTQLIARFWAEAWGSPQ